MHLYYKKQQHSITPEKRNNMGGIRVLFWMSCSLLLFFLTFFLLFLRVFVVMLYVN